MLQTVSVRRVVALFFAAVYAAIAVLSFSNLNWLWSLVILLPLTVAYFQNIWLSRHSILRNYPLLGYLRFAFEGIRPEIRQYFFESDLDGKPFSRRQRSIVYQLAKNVRHTVPFGMQTNSQEIGFEWMAHTMFPVHIKEDDLRVTIGS